MQTNAPIVFVLGGPNGAGKTTIAPRLLRDTLAVVEFVNADTLARGLAAFDPDVAALEAGRLMFHRIRQLGLQGRSFAFETTLASRSLVPWLASLLKSGYEFHLAFLWLPSADVAIERVLSRSLVGGHNVPESTVRRRYARGLVNFFGLYQPLASKWRMYDNTEVNNMRLIAAGSGHNVDEVEDRTLWEEICRRHRDAK